jgi:hypothetical protein
MAGMGIVESLCRPFIMERRKFPMFKYPDGGITRKFKAIFGWQIMNYFSLLYGFNITKFDDDLKEQYGDYEDGATSLKDFIKDKFGDNAVGVIEKLI